jgi:hypothetical protein
MIFYNFTLAFQIHENEWQVTEQRSNSLMYVGINLNIYYFNIVVKYDLKITHLSFNILANDCKIYTFNLLTKYGQRLHFNTKKSRTFGIVNQGPGLRQTQQCGG